jgi:trehalose utilization protein
MEPYFQDPDFYNIPADGAEYCKYGQIPFLKLNFKGSWIEGAITVNVNQASHPVMAGLPSTFDIDSYKQWDRLDIFDDPMITDKQYLASTAAGEAQVISFNYGKGRVVLLGSDDNWYAAGTPAMQRLIQNSTEWTAPHGL